MLYLVARKVLKFVKGRSDFIDHTAVCTKCFIYYCTNFLVDVSCFISLRARKVLRFGEAMLKLERRLSPRLEAMRGLPAPSHAPPREKKTREEGGFSWPAGLDRVEFWKEGRAVVSLTEGGRALGEGSLEWLTNN